MSRAVIPHVSSALGKLAKKHAYFSQRIEYVSCPDCGKSYEIVPSRRELVQPVAKIFFSFYRCRICDGRFRRPRTWFRWVSGITGYAVAFCAVWLAIQWLM
jgi:hypothetical protein